MPQKLFWRKSVSLYRVFYEKDLTYINWFSIQKLWGKKKNMVWSRKFGSTRLNKDKDVYLLQDFLEPSMC